MGDVGRIKIVKGPPRVYIAGKFRGPKNQDVQRHIDVASWFRALIAEAGAFPVCVHVGEGLAMHDVQQENNGQFWLDVTLDELRTCDAVVVVPGWQTSSGTFAEVQEALQLGMPVFEGTWQHTLLCDDMPVPSSPKRWDKVGLLSGVPGAAGVEYDFTNESWNFHLWLRSVLANAEAA